MAAMVQFSADKQNEKHYGAHQFTTVPSPRGSSWGL